MAAWKAWAETPLIDFEGRHNAYGLQALARKTAADTGECLLRERALTSAQALPAEAPGAGEHLRPTSSDEVSDAAAMADLVNSELADQARRHGVDVA